MSLTPIMNGPWQEKVCGRPLGLRFAPDGHLVVVDAYLGLFSIDVDNGQKEQLFDISQEIEGVVPKLPDDLDIDSEGNIYWSDASTVSNLIDAMIEVLSDPSGRLIKFDPKTKTNTVLVKNVHFANGVQLSPDHDFVLLSETCRSRVLRHWLKGPKSGQTEVFVDRLPGLPDNIRSKDGGYYVSLIIVKIRDIFDPLHVLAKFPILRKLILRVLAVTKYIVESIGKIYTNQHIEELASRIFHLQSMSEFFQPISNLTMVVELDADGNIVNSLQCYSGKMMFISETSRVGDFLFFGSPYNKYLGRLFVGSSFMEVDGKGVKIEGEDTDRNEAEIKDEESDLWKDGNGFLVEKEKVFVEEETNDRLKEKDAEDIEEKSSLKEKNAEDTEEKSKDEEFANEGKVEPPMKRDFDSALDKDENAVEEEAFKVENRDNTEENQKQNSKQEEIGGRGDYTVEEVGDIQKGEETKEMPNLEKQIVEILKDDIIKEEL
ncbi:adipocyte plasma membrane-associated protein Hemomucin-like isoform X2 [Panulirus ornatus]|uniref:adipocyte plasma membrane-associated protein Hemomucin-like isoform X2 n=1 Tax=Panulirus ornatus TaxID=150431 RepID=UPI003A87D455